VGGCLGASLGQSLDARDVRPEMRDEMLHEISDEAGRAVAAARWGDILPPIRAVRTRARAGWPAFVPTR
jgi:hypothetical protein